MGDRDHWPDQPDPHRHRPGQDRHEGNGGGGDDDTEYSDCPDEDDEGTAAEEMGPHGPGSDPDD